MELIFLGTGAGIPSKNRNVSALALMLLQEKNSIWLFDCGEATQHQLLYTNIKPNKVTKIFITHMHGDHLYGLPGFLSSRSFQGGTDPLRIYGPPGIKEYVETSLRLSHSRLAYPLFIHEISEGCIYDDTTFAVTCRSLDHGVPSFGFRIVEKDKPGRLLVEELQKMGIPPGPIYQEIKENESVTVPDVGTVYHNDVIGPPKKGRIVSILGDTRYHKGHLPLVRDADVLVHEATFDASSAKRAHAYHHSTTEEAAQLAKEGRVKNLLLTHISSRYQGNDNEQLLAEARSIFADTHIVHDFFHFDIPSD